MLRQRASALGLLAALALGLGLAPAHPAAAQPQVAEPFRAYYAAHDGMRVLGPPLTDLVMVGGIAAQYFEKGRMEDHYAEVSDPAWGIMYGRLTADLIEGAPMMPVSETDISYADIADGNRPEARRPAPAGFTGGTAEVSEGTWPVMFVPYDSQLRPAPGYTVPMYFWDYMNRRDLFPGGWLHDIGLPMTPLRTVTATKGAEQRTVQLQAFERAVLTYDVKNPPEWMVERANLGSDTLSAGGPLAVNEIERPAMGERVALPFPLLARVGRPGDQVTARISWGQGPQFINTFTALPSERPGDERGLVIGLIDWVLPRDPPTGRAVLTLHDAAGEVLAWREVQVLGPGDAGAHEVTLFWLFGEVVRPHPQQIVAGERVEAAALEALLWGPPRTQMSFHTALPTPQEVLAYPGRQPDWGARVTLRSLDIRDGVATADFSPELLAYGGGSARVLAIREQITRTLTSFPGIQTVRITVAGRTDALEP